MGWRRWHRVGAAFIPLTAGQGKVVRLLRIHITRPHDVIHAMIDLSLARSGHSATAPEMPLVGC